MTAPEYGSADWAMRYARDYRYENQAKDALRALADEVIELRAGNRLLRELVERWQPERPATSLPVQTADTVDGGAS